MIAIYVRLSKEDEDSNSIENQIREGKDFAKKHKQPYKIYNEGEGVSGTLPLEKRPLLQSLFFEIKEGVITAVWMRNQNRLARNEFVNAMFVNLVKEHNVSVTFGSGEKLDFNDPTTNLTTSILASLNSYQANLQSAQTKKSIHDNVREGKVHGVIPYGYQSDENKMLVINEGEAEIIKRIFDLKLKGYGNHKIASTLEKEGILTPKNKGHWFDANIGKIVNNPIYKGERIFNKEVYKAPAIIEPHVFDKAQKVLAENKQNTGKSVNLKYMLKGILICGVCGKKYYARSVKDAKYHYYKCSSKRYRNFTCSSKGINVIYLEGFIWERFFKDEYLTEKVKEHLNSSELPQQINDLEQKHKGFDKEIDKLTKERQNAVRMAIKGLIGDEDIQPEIQRIEANINEELEKQKRIREQIDFLEKSAVNEKDISNEIGKVKDTTDFITKREIVRKYIKEIYIKFFGELKMYVLNIEFNLPIKEELYFIPTNYHYALAIFDRIIIPMKQNNKQLTANDWEKLQIKVIEAFNTK